MEDLVYRVRASIVRVVRSMAAMVVRRLCKGVEQSHEEDDCEESEDQVSSDRR